MPLRKSSVKEIPLQASKWLQLQVLLDSEEIACLFKSLLPFFLYTSGAICPLDKGAISLETFLGYYKEYIETIKMGKIPDQVACRSLFSPVLTASLEALFSIPIGIDRQIIRVSSPVIQLQAHTLDYSSVDKKFHSMVFGNDSISWGIQFSYPQLIQDTETKQVETIKDNPKFVNTALFQAIQKWIRQATIPVPFIVDDRVIHVPIRIGKKCLPWINQHPQLIKKNLKVKVSTHLSPHEH